MVLTLVVRQEILHHEQKRMQQGKRSPLHRKRKGTSPGKKRKRKVPENHNRNRRLTQQETSSASAATSAGPDKDLVDALADEDLVVPV